MDLSPSSWRGTVSCERLRPQSGAKYWQKLHFFWSLLADQSIINRNTTSGSSIWPLYSDQATLPFTMTTGT